MQLNNNLSDLELEIFSRQLLVKGWGLAEQLSLKSANVFIKGENEISARYLIAAGVTNIYLDSKNLLNTLNGYELFSKLYLVNDFKQIPENTIIIDVIESNSLIPAILAACETINKITNPT